MSTQTLKQAINSETTSSSEQKTDQLEFLSETAEDLTQSDLEGILSGYLDSYGNVSLADVYGIRQLINYRIKEGLPILPFDFSGGVDFIIF